MSNEFKISNTSYLFSRILFKIIFFIIILFGFIILFTIFNFLAIIITSIILFFVYIIGCYIIWYKHGREYSRKEINYNQKYEFNLPYNDDPLLANYFIEGKMSNNWFSSGILYLIWKKVYSFEKINKKDYLIKLKKPNQKLPIYVQKIHDFLENYFVDNQLDLIEFQKKIEGLDFIKKGNNYNIKTYNYNIKDYNSKPYVNQDYVNFGKLYKSVSKEYYILFHSEEFYIKKGYLIFKNFLMAFLIITIIFSFLLSTYFILIFSLIIIVYFYNTFSPTVIFGKFTKKGILRNLRWNAFKNHIQDHSSIKTHPINHVILWDEYLIYGTAFGIAKKVSLSLDIGVEISKKLELSFFDTLFKKFI